jgi:hypothetical protein
MGAVSLELRVASSRHRTASGSERSRTRKELRRLLATFTEGFETGDLREARAAVGN